MNFGRGGYQSVSSYGGGGGNYGGGGDGGYGGGGGGGGGGYGGGGYGGGGGGYIQGSQGFTSPGLSPGGGGKGQRSKHNQTVTHVTSAQLLSADEVQEGIFNISGKEVGMVCVIGEVMEVTTSATNVVYNVDDRTGPCIKVQKWMSSDPEPSEDQERMTVQEGMYIQAIGHLKVFNKQRSVTAFYIKPVTDFNELSHHLAEVMYAHLTSTKGAPVPEQFRDRGGQQMGGGAWGAPMATSTQVGGGSFYSGSRQDNSMTPLQQHVLNVISNCPQEQGINVKEVVDTMKKHSHDDNKVKNAIEFLCTEGHIYSTIDDYHYKSTDA